MIFTIWYIAIGVQVVITLLLAMQFLRYRDAKSGTKNSLSIVIASHNELNNLEKIIPGLLKQHYTNFEIIVSLDRCTDDSEAFLHGIPDSKLKIIRIDTTPPKIDHKKYALTQAIGKASGDWLVFTDADCLPASKHWLESINSKITPKMSLILGYSPYTNEGSLLQQFTQFEGFVTAYHYLSLAIVGSPYMGVGRNMAVRKSFFHQSGGYKDFQSTTGGDDDLFVQKNANSKNTVIVIGRNSMVFTFPKKNWKEYLAQKTRHLAVGVNYSIKDKMLHVLYNTSLSAIWTLLPFLTYEIFLPIILFYLFIKLIGYRFAHSKMGAGFNYMWLPLVDFMYAIFLPIIAIRSKLVKDIRWKN